MAITPIASNPATLAPLTSQPAVTGTTTTGTTNSRTSTAYVPSPAPAAGGNGIAGAVAGVANQNASTAATQARAVQTVSSQFGAPLGQDFSTAANGGAISSALENGVAKIAAFAQNGITGIKQAMQADMAANNGQVDPAKMQQYTMQMSTFELIMQMAAKIQESEKSAAQVWMR